MTQVLQVLQVLLELREKGEKPVLKVTLAHKASVVYKVALAHKVLLEKREKQVLRVKEV